MTPRALTIARRAGREAAVFALYLLIAVAMTWPLVRHLDTAVSDLGDPLVNMWIIDWVCHALVTDPLDLYHAPLYYPGRYALAHSENLIGVAVLVLPFHLAGAAPIAVYNIALLIGFALSGYGAFVLARLVTRSTAASLVAGVVFAFVPFKFDHLAHLQIITSGWLPLLLAALIAYWRDARPRTAALLTAAFVMNGLTNVHYFLFGSLTAVATIAALAIIDPRRGRRFWLTLGAALVAGGLILLPFLLPYRILAKEHGMVRSEGEARSGSAPPVAWLVATPRSVVYGDVGAPELHRHEMQLFPGLVAILLACAAALYGAMRAPAGTYEAPPPKPRPLGAAVIVGLAILTWMGIVTDRTEWSIAGQRIVSFDSADVPAMLLLIAIVVRTRHRLHAFVARSRFTPEAWAAVLWIAIGVVGSFGMNTFFHAFLYRRIGVFQAIRAPVRWAVIAYIGLAVWAAIGALVLLRGRRGVRRAVIASLLVIVSAADLWPRIRWEHAVKEPAPVYRWLARVRVAPIIELPMAGGSEFSYLYGSVHHRLPQFNGVTHFSGPVHTRLRVKNDALEFDEELLDILERHGGRLVIVHAHALGETSEAIRSWLQTQIAAGRLAYVRSFDHEVGGDFVFAITRNFPGWQRYAEAEAPDGAGHLPRQKLARMLAGRTTHSNTILWRIESPQPGEVVRGPLRVRGWALSPFPITRVTILIDSGSVRIDVPLTDERPDVKRDYHWYYFVPRPGFEQVIPSRPRGIPRQTDLQIEIADEGGRVMRTADVPFDWEEAP